MTLRIGKFTMCLAPKRKAHLLITLLTFLPIPILVNNVSAEPSFPALDAAPRPALPSPMSINPHKRTRGRRAMNDRNE